MRIFSFSRLKCHMKYHWLPHLVDLMLGIAVIGGIKALKAKGVKRVLIDNTILGHGITHKTVQINSGLQLWGETEIESGYLARVPKYSDNDVSCAAVSVRYLPAIAHIAKALTISLLTSDELLDERWTQPIGRYRGKGFYDFNLFSKVDFTQMRDLDYSFALGPRSFKLPSMKEQRKTRLNQKDDDLYRKLIDALGENNSQDAWHILTAERNDCYCFLTMDFKLIRNMSAQKNNPAVAQLRTKVLTPEEFGKEFGLPQVSTRLFSYHDASFPVRSDLNESDLK
jgi:hypothetical protein